MPRLNISLLIEHLEELDENLGMIWGLVQNYEILEAIEQQRRKLNQIIDTLRNYLELL
jgi:hypothetical protein